MGFPGVLSGGVRMFVVLLLSLFHIPRVACLAAICEKWRILLCFSLLGFLLYIASLPDLDIFDLPSLLYLWCFRFWFRFFDIELFFSFCPFFLLLGGMCSSRFLWQLVQRTARIWYVRARNVLFRFCPTCRCASAIMCAYFSCLFHIFYTERGISTTPSQCCYWSLSCDHGLRCIVAMSK